MALMMVQKNSLTKKNIHWEKIFLWVILFYYTLQLCFYATSIHPAFPPDEIRHIQLSLVYRNHLSLFLPDTKETFHLGAISHLPTLYFWIMGRFIFLRLSFLPAFLFLRFVNVLFSLLTAFIAYRLFQELSDGDKVSPLLSLFVLTNIPMYSFLGASVNYDNLTNLSAVFCLYFLFRFIKSHQYKYFAASWIFLLLGTLIKYTLLPFGLILVVIYAWEARRRSQQKQPFIETNGSYSRLAKITFIFIILFLSLLNLRLYGMNLWQFRKFIPKCDQVLPVSQCNRQENFRVRRQLEERALIIPKNQFLPPQDYFTHWKIFLEKGVFGILGHRLMFRTSWALLPYNLLLLAFLIFFIRYFDPHKPLFLYSAISILLYWVVLFGINYQSYLATFYIPEALQGRYIFPVIYPFVFLFVYFLTQTGSQWRRTLFTGLILIVFAWGNLPYFIQHADKFWYMKNPATVQEEIMRVK